MVGRDAAREPVEELVVAQDVQVLLGQGPRGLLDPGEDLVTLGRRGEAGVGLHQLGDSGVAARTAEDEHDRRQQPLAVEALDHLDAAGDPHAAAVADGTRVLRRPGPALARRAPVAHQPAAGPVVARDPGQLLVDRRALLDEAGARIDVGGGEQVEQPTADHDVLEQRHGPLLLQDGGRLATHGGQPLAELLGVGDRRRQRHQGHRLRQVDDDLLPDRATHPVGEVVDLVHHDVAEAQQRARAGVEHVAEHLGGHHDDRRLAVDHVVAGQQADVVGAVAPDQVVVLLVGQRLDRRRVERLAARLQRQVDGELTDDRLAGAGRRGDQDTAAALDLPARAHLEVVELEAVEAGEVLSIG